MPRLHYVAGNDIQLLRGGQQYFASLEAAIRQSAHEVLLETYIFNEDPATLGLIQALIGAARRGVAVRVVIDWVGSGTRHAERLAARLNAEGVACRCFNPWFRRGLARTHRKLAVVDRALAWVGGINLIDDLRSDEGRAQTLTHPRWDFAVRLIGPLVEAVHLEVHAQWQRMGALEWHRRLLLLRDLRKEDRQQRSERMPAAFIVRDNLRNRSTILRAYLQALGTARTRAWLANPYFAPGRKLRRALINAAGRGVDVVLLLGVGQFALQDAITKAYYPHLLQHGVRIIEYRKTSLHAKVAVIDYDWATVGSSNFDGLSLFLNHEANIVIRDRLFTDHLAHQLHLGMQDGVEVAPSAYGNWPWHKRLAYGLAYQLYRLFMHLMTWGRFG